MILVVICHVSGICLGIESDISSFHLYLYEFRMPTFFFVSGFVLFKEDRKWNWNTVYQFICNKFRVQIITTIIFFFVYLHVNNISIIDGIYNDSKFGYWFTYTLFIYFVSYSFSQWFLHHLKLKSWQIDTLSFFLGLAIYFLFQIRSIFNMLQINCDIVNILSMQHWGFFFFFIIGTLIRKHYNKVLVIIDLKYTMFFLLSIYLGLNIFHNEMISNHLILFRFFTALSGVLIVFSFFYKNQEHFASDKLGGKCLQYIGRRTLDIYLIHNLILPKNLFYITSFLRVSPMPIIELTISLIISSLIISFCLALSKVLRLSPILAYLLFGIKNK